MTEKQRLFHADGASMGLMPIGPLQPGTAPGVVPPQVVAPKPIGQIVSAMDSGARVLRQQTGVNPVNQGGGADGGAGGGEAAGGRYEEYRDADGDYSLRWTLPTRLLTTLAQLGAKVYATYEAIGEDGYSMVSHVTVENASTTTSGRKKSTRYYTTYVLLPHTQYPNRHLENDLNALNALAAWWDHFDYEQDYARSEESGDHYDALLFSCLTQEGARMLVARMEALVYLGCSLVLAQEKGASIESVSNPAYRDAGGYEISRNSVYDGYKYTVSYLIPYVPSETPAGGEVDPGEQGLEDADLDDIETVQSDPVEEDEDRLTLLGFTLPKWVWMVIAAGVVLLIVTMIAIATKPKKK